MKLSKYLRYTPDYAEYGWVCAPNATAQSIAANTVTVLNVDTIVSDDNSLLSVPAGNVFIIPEGVWHVEAWAAFGSDGNYTSSLIALYDKDNGKYISRAGDGSHTNYTSRPLIETQLKLAAATQFNLKILTNIAGGIRTPVYAGAGAFTNSTAGLDQRTSIKLWRLQE